MLPVKQQVGILAVAKALPNRRGAANSTFMTAFDLGIGVGSTLLGGISQFWGYSGMFRVGGSLVILSLLVFLIWRPSGEVSAQC